VTPGSARYPGARAAARVHAQIFPELSTGVGGIPGPTGVGGDYSHDTLRTKVQFEKKDSDE
jgi:hypothetical protein